MTGYEPRDDVLHFERPKQTNGMLHFKIVQDTNLVWFRPENSKLNEPNNISCSNDKAIQIL